MFVNTFIQADGIAYRCSYGRLHLQAGPALEAAYASLPHIAGLRSLQKPQNERFLPERVGIWECSRMPRQADIAGCLLSCGFQGEKDNIVYFSAGFEAFKYTSQRSGAFTVLDLQEEKHPVPEENGFRGFAPYKNLKMKNRPFSRPVSILELIGIEPTTY